MNKANKSNKLLKQVVIIILAIFSLGQLQRLQITPTIAVYVHDILIAGWLIWFAAANSSLIVAWSLRIKKLLLNNKTISLLLGWILLGMGLHIITAGLDFIPSLYLIRALSYTAFAFSAAYLINDSYSTRALWFAVGLLILFLGLLQYIFLPDTRFLHLFGWDDHYYRLISTIFDPAFTGMILVMSLAYLFSLSDYNISNNHHLKILQNSILQISSSLIIAVGILLTYSRSSMLALVVFLISLAATKIKDSDKFRKKNMAKTILLFLSIPILLVLVYFIAPKPGGLGVNLLRTNTIWARFANTSSALKSVDVPTLLVGKGLFTPTIIDEFSPNSTHALVPDNLFTMLLLALGVPGLVLSIYGLIYFGKELYWRDKVFFCLYLGLLIHSQFNNTILQPFVLLYLLGGINSFSKRKKASIEK